MRLWLKNKVLDSGISLILHHSHMGVVEKTCPIPVESAVREGQTGIHDPDIWSSIEPPIRLSSVICRSSANCQLSPMRPAGLRFELLFFLE